MNYCSQVKVLEIEMTGKKNTTDVTGEEKEKRDQLVKNGKIELPPEDHFFIAGLGASAGGLEAFEEFFKNLPGNTGAGFVIITHLDPAKKDIMHDLI